MEECHQDRASAQLTTAEGDPSSAAVPSEPSQVFASVEAGARPFVALSGAPAQHDVAADVGPPRNATTAEVAHNRYNCVDGRPVSVFREAMASRRSFYETPADFVESACSKRCYNAIMKARQSAAAPMDGPTKRRVFWHNDGPSDDVSSLSVLIDWLTSGDNYTRYRGGDGQNGETKLAHAQDIVRLMASSGIKTARTAKDVTNKISSLETTFKTASDWLAETGQGVKDGQSLRAAILDRCPQYYELQDIMQNRPGIRPLLLSTDENADNSDEDTDSDEDGTSDEETKSNSDKTSTICERSKTIPISIVKNRTKPRSHGDFSPHLELARVKEAKLGQDRELQLMELTVKKRHITLQEQEFEFKRQKSNNEERVAEAKIKEAEAQTSKLRYEAEHWKQQNKIELLRQRKRLLDEGVASEDIDLLLPLSAGL